VGGDFLDESELLGGVRVGGGGGGVGGLFGGWRLIIVDSSVGGDSIYRFELGG